MKRVAELLNMSGRVAVVAGGAGHIGFACCQALAESGASVSVVDLDVGSCSERAESLSEWVPGTEHLGVGADITDETAVRDVIARTLARFGRIDVLIHCAALTGDSALRGYAVPFAEQTLAAWQAAVTINLSSAFLLAREALPALQASTHGSIINVSSIYGLVGPDLSLYEGTHMGNPAAYGATKGGLLQLTRYLSTVAGPKVRVNAISPGGIERQQPTAFRERYMTRTPLRRLGKEEDLKGAVAFLASDASAYVTGHNLVIDGGWTAW